MQVARTDTATPTTGSPSQSSSVPGSPSGPQAPGFKSDLKPDLRAMDFAAGERALTPTDAAPSERRARVKPRRRADPEPAKRGGATTPAPDNEMLDRSHLEAVGRAHEVHTSKSPVSRDMQIRAAEEERKANAEVRELDRELEVVDAELDELKKTGQRGTVPGYEQKKKELEAKQKESEKRADAARKDREALESQVTSKRELNDIAARRGVKSTPGPDQETSQTRRVDSDKATAAYESKTTKNHMDEDGVSRTTTSGATTQVDMSTGGLSRETTESEKVVSGATTTTRSDASKSGYDVTSNTFKTSRTKSETSETEGKKAGKSHTSGVSVSEGGLTFSDANSTTKDDKTTTTSTTSGATRGDGQVGYSRGKSEETKVEGGAESKRESSTEGGVIAGKDGVGAYAKREESRSKKFANGLEVNGKAAVGGRATYNIIPIPDTQPQKYQVQIAIKLDASLSAGAGASKEASQGSQTSGNIGGKGNLSASITAAFGNRLDEAATDAWVKQLANPQGGAGSGYAEFQIIAAGVSQGWGAARDLYERVYNKGDVTNSLRDGQSVSFKTETRGGGEVEGGGKGGGASAGLGGGYSRSHEVEGEVSRDGDKTTTSIKVKDGSETSGNAKVGMGAASFTFGGKKTRSAGKGFKFEIPDSHPNAAGLRRELEGLTTQEEIAAFAARHPDLVKERSTSKGEGLDTTQGIAVGPLDATMTSGGSTSHDHTESYDAKTGKKTETDKHVGESHIGGKVKLGKFDLGGSNRQEQLESEVTTTTDANGKKTQTAQGDLSDTHTSSDIDAAGTLNGLTSKPLGKLTGSDPVLKSKETKNVAGVLLSDGDFERIMQLAKDPRAWAKGFSRVANMEDWELCRQAVLKAGNDKEQVTKALAAFMGGGEHDRINNVKELLGSDVGGGGARYEELPEALKKAYRQWVVDDVLGDIKALEEAGQIGNARQMASDGAARCGELHAHLQVHGDDFKDKNVYAEMLKRTAERKTKLENKLDVLRLGDDPMYEKDDVERIGGARTYTTNLNLCKDYCAIERGLFERLHAMWDGTTGQSPEWVKLVNELGANAKLWKPIYAEMCEVAKRWNIAPKHEYIDLKPDEVRLRYAYGGKDPYGSEAETAQTEADSSAKEKSLRQKEQDEAGKAVLNDMALQDLEKPAARTEEDFERDRQRQLPGLLSIWQGIVGVNRNTLSVVAAKFNKMIQADGGTTIKGAARGEYARGRDLGNQAEKVWKGIEGVYRTAKSQKYINGSFSGYVAIETFNSQGKQMVQRFSEAFAAYKSGDSLQG